MSLSFGILLGVAACIAMVMAMNAAAPRKFVDVGLWTLLASISAEGSDPQNVLRALLRIARLRRESGDHAAARDALERASRHPDCVGTWKSAVDREAALLYARPA